MDTSLERTNCAVYVNGGSEMFIVPVITFDGTMKCDKCDSDMVTLYRSTHVRKGSVVEDDSFDGCSEACVLSQFFSK